MTLLSEVHMQKKVFSGKVILSPTDQKQLANFFSLLIQIDKRISVKRVKKQKIKNEPLDDIRITYGLVFIINPFIFKIVH